MRCHEMRQQLAVYRELSQAERERLQGHIATCPGCAATLAAYQAQDQLLSALPVLRPSPQLDMAVRSSTVGQRRPAHWLSWQRAAVVVSLLVLISTAWGTISVAADALPGDPLYALKRGGEQVRLALTLDLTARDQYRQQLAETRRDEVRAVLRLQREAQVEFQGELVAIDDGVWLVDGFRLAVGADAWEGVPPPTGSSVSIEAQASRGELTARRVRMLEAPSLAPTPHVSPTLGVWPSPTPTGTATPTPHPTEGQAPAGPSAEPHGTHMAGPGAQPSATPGRGGPGFQPSATPGPQSPDPHRSATPGPGGPGPQRTATPGSGEPNPQPSATSAPGGPGPQPSATPGSRKPGSRPSATSAPSGPGARRSATPGKGGH